MRQILILSCPATTTGLKTLRSAMTTRPDRARPILARRSMSYSIAGAARRVALKLTNKRCGQPV